ncbi:aspartate/glutamate racemase family protein [Saccharopolyspora hirsuta]|uniref:Hydantoin racemase n=1 Tax=Saccharopolyspora hirsuta TaxID=1837 RepID=A0A5M7BHL6_SACHI|nr:aspartate/glutamate racemase family protein [Saccharopolyspora hirsuta]KAA5827051.1 hydantoin racemase [Saccharopolyspora hirsuta]
MPHTDAPTVVVVNPNTNRETTAMMVDLAQRHLAPAGLAVEGITVARGPSMIVEPGALAEAAGHVVDAVRRHLAGPTGDRVGAVIVGAIGDPGRAELAAALDVPVVGIGQASILAAAARGRRFGMATSTPLLVDSLTGLVRAHGSAETFTGVRLTSTDPLELAARPEQQYAELAEAARACVADGAEAVIVAGGPLSRTARQLAELGFVEIVEPLPSASRMVLDLVAGRPAAAELG